MTTAGKRVPERTRTAYHESGHALLAHLERIGFRHVTIRPGEDSLGHVLLRPFSEKFRPDLDVNTDVRRRIESRVMLDFAGRCAEQLLVRGRVRTGFTADFSSAVDLASHIHFDEKLLSSYLDYLWVRTETTLTEPPNWKAVESLAVLLLQKETVGYREAKRVLEQARMRGFADWKAD